MEKEKYKMTNQYLKKKNNQKPNKSVYLPSFPRRMELSVNLAKLCPEIKFKND